MSAGEGKKQHWENIYQTKRKDEVGWYQPEPTTSLYFLKICEVPKKANIVDVGGGDSYLADCLLERGHENITVVDISEKALDKARQRLGSEAEKVNWIVADAANFQPPETYDFWHDRATFHFLRQEQEIQQYLQTARNHINPSGYLVLGTFSEEGPEKCSGLKVKQYSEHSMTERVKDAFEKIHCIKTDHQTPSQTTQNFLFCSFKRKE